MRAHLRADLQQRGQDLEQQPLVLVCAPGGSGKSTLVRAWQQVLHTAGGRMAWVALRELHSDPIVFVEDWVEAIREVQPEPLEGAELFGTALLRAIPRSGEIGPGPIVRLMERELRMLARPLVVCLDAFEHLAADGESVEIVDQLLRVESQWLRFVITSRGLQPKVTARMLADGSAIEIGATDLSLRTDQMQSVLEDAGVQLEPRQAEQLLARTEGWAIAIRFAARALAGVPLGERSRFIDELVRERDLFRYIASELVGGIAPELAATLEVASILGPVRVDTLASALDAAHAREQIDEAIELGLLYSAGDEVFVHELLADWMRIQMEARLSDSAWRELHLRLGRLVESRGGGLSALRIYRSAGLVKPLADLLAREGHAWVNRGHYELASEALDELPEELRQSSPALIAVAGVIECGRDPDTAIENLKLAIEMYRKAGDRTHEFEALHELAIVATNENRMSSVQGLFRRALPVRRVLLEPRLRGMVALALAGGSSLVGRYAIALRLADVAATFDHAPRERAGITLLRSTIHFYRGDWDRVIAEVDERCADEEQRRHGPGFFAIQTRRCAAVGLRGIDVAGCRETLTQASQMFVTSRQSLNHLISEVTHGQIAMREGDLDASIELFTHAIALSRRINLVEEQAACQGMLARAHQNSGQHAEAIEASELALGLLEQEDAWNSKVSNVFASPGVALAAVVHAELADPKRAGRALEQKAARLIHRELPLCGHAIRLCMARVDALMGDEGSSQKNLREALQIHRQAKLRDFAPEVDDALLRWASTTAVQTGIETREVPTEAVSQGTARTVQIRIDTLGGLVVTRGDKKISDREWRGTTPKRLLVRLLASEGRPLARERIEAELWPDASAFDARNSLRVALSRLRDVLEPRRNKGAASRYVEVEGERISLTEDALTGWDVRSWRNALSDLATATEQRDATSARSALDRIRAVHRGAFLPEYFEEWSLELRRSLDEEWLRVGRRGASGWPAAGNTDLAIEIATALLESHPDDEVTWENLAQARLRAGDRSGALRTINEAKAALRSQLDMDPGPGLIQLEAEIRSTNSEAQ